MIPSLKLRSSLNRMLSIGALSICLAGTSSATIVSVSHNFNSLGEIGNFDYQNQNSSSVGYDMTGGIGGSGAAVFQSTGASGLDKRTLGVYSPGTTDTDSTTLGTPTFALDATTTSSFRASILVHGSAIGDTDLGGKRKAQVRFGFLSSLNISDPTKPQDIWKQNASFVMDAKIEFENADGKYAKLSIEPKVSSGINNAELKAPKVEIQNDGLGAEFEIDNWFRFDLVITRYTGGSSTPDSFSFGGELLDLGPDGTDEPLSLGVSTYVDAFNNSLPFINLTQFSTDSSIFFAYQLEIEKAASPGEYTFQVDNMTFEAVPEANSLGLALVGSMLLGRRRRTGRF